MTEKKFLNLDVQRCAIALLIFVYEAMRHYAGHEFRRSLSFYILFYVTFFLAIYGAAIGLTDVVDASFRKVFLSISRFLVDIALLGYVVVIVSLHIQTVML